ncbi:MAG: radical SAM protein [Anaerolineae bacterium]|jgi:radical SAM superfamily enzyme YgiQ (UPF0313 family)|nr:radical SAM protein [Anaerolineae bacterium]MBT7783869.1 radical SAM protein [Anaerolineae bacterium]
MRYHGMVIRPPSEAKNYILQVSYGCSHNKCTFCGTYLDKAFRPRNLAEILEDISLAKKEIPATCRVFLADGDALVLPTTRLIKILDELKLAFPQLERVGCYANARDILRKTPKDLKRLHEKGLKIIYIGLESGDDETLKFIEKGATAAEMVEAALKAKEAGILISLIGILGLGQQKKSAQHAIETGRVISEMNPDFFSMLTLMLVPGTKLHAQWEAGEFKLLSPKEMLAELRQVIENLNGLSNCIFRTNHASNYLPLRGTFPQDKEGLLAMLDAALKGGKNALRPEAWRGL